jgi:hypothetical protein
MLEQKRTWMPVFTGMTNFHIVCKAKSLKHPESCINLRRARLVKLTTGLTLHNRAHKNDLSVNTFLRSIHGFH